MMWSQYILNQQIILVHQSREILTGGQSKQPTQPNQSSVFFLSAPLFLCTCFAIFWTLGSSSAPLCTFFAKFWTLGSSSSHQEMVALVVVECNCQVVNLPILSR